MDSDSADVIADVVTALTNQSVVVVVFDNIPQVEEEGEGERGKE